MTDDITSLQIRIKYLEVQQAEKSLDKFDKTARGSAKGMIGWAAAAAAATTAAAGFNAIVQKTRQFQVLQAQLETATGSAENMAVAWEALIKFASQTPFSLEQSVSAFTKLVNYGLTPSERALRSYGDTAAATGKNFDQLVEAVADAVNGEFERTKEAFNVKAKNLGDTVEFRFRGITTTVKNNAREIEEYFMKLGEANFAGGMQKRMETLDGAISNLGDTWDQLLFALGNEGIGDAAEDGIRGVTAALEELRDMVASGQMGEYLDNFFDQIRKETGDLGGIFREAASELSKFVGFAEVSAAEWEAYWEEAFGNFPSSLAYMVKRAGVELGTFVNIVAAISADAAGHLVANMQAGFRKVEGMMKEAASWAPGASPFDLPAWQAETDSIFNSTLPSNTDARIESFLDSRTEELDKLASDWQEAADKTEAAINSAKWKRHLYEDRQNGIEQGPVMPGEIPLHERDALEGFGVLPPPGAVEGGSLGGGGGSSKRKGRSGGGGSGRSDYERLERELQRHLENSEEMISESYAKRFAMIESNTRQGSELQMQLEMALTEEWEAEQMQRVEVLKRVPESMREAFELEEDILKESYERRKEIILSATEVTEREKLALLAKLDKEYKANRFKVVSEDINSQLEVWGGMFENLEALGSAYGKKGFEMQKAAAMASAAITGAQAVLNAYNEGLKISVYAAPAFAAVAAAVVGAQIGQIAATEYSGAYATGGMIPAGKWGVVGEAGAEVVRGPAMVTSAQATADHYGSGGGKAQNVTVNVINGEGVAAETRERETPDGRVIEVLTRQIESNLNRRMDEGSSPLARTLEKRYNLRRGS